MRRLRLRTRVLAGVLSATLLVLTAFDITAVSVLHRYLIGRTDSNLRSALTMTYPQLDIMVTNAWRMVPAVGAYDIAYVPNGRQRPVILQHGVNPVPVASLVAGTSHWIVTRRGTSAVFSAQTILASYRVEQVTLPAGVLVASTTLGDVDATTSRFRLIVIAGSAVAGLLIFCGVVLAMRRGLRPIEAMAAQADRITAGDLARRVDCTDVPSEVGRLGTALNGLLTRVEAHIAERQESQELMRRFFADASHELRTPLASLRANAELYQQGALRRRTQVDEAVRRITIEAERMSVLVDDMLRLARLDQHPSMRHESVDLAGLIEQCVAAQAAEPDRKWRVDVAAGLTVAGDEELLRRAVGNLVANVATHTPAGTTASVIAAVTDAQIVVTVSDDGPGVPDDQLPRIFERFYRAGAPSGRPGSGLGLAIVAGIAAQHGGGVTATANDPSGLRVELRLPVKNLTPA